MASEDAPTLVTPGTLAGCLNAHHDMVIPKKYVNMHALGALEQRVAKLLAPTPGVVRCAAFQPTQNQNPPAIVGVSPLFVTIRAADASRQLFKGSLKELQRPLADDEALIEMAKMSRIILNLHRYGIVHGRLSISSWREDDNNALCLVDASVPIAAMPMTAPVMRSVAHLLAPEVVAAAGGGEGATAEQMISPAADVWGLAVCYLQLVLQGKQFNTLERMDIMDADIMCPLLNTLRPQAVSILVRCLKQDPLARPSVEELFCELTNQPNSHQASMMAMMMGGSDDEENEDGEEEEEDEEEEEEADG